PVTLHSLRHTNATLLIAAGVNVKTVSAHLGHSTIATTANIYAHQIQSAEAAAADALEEKLRIAKRKHA
ncbi:MAG: tyrosine-type recombinase/integrase, partial [Clostridiales bacterium]|nr:tyrosine-type recombinase/integrase [Clostridiales bacterium]